MAAEVNNVRWLDEPVIPANHQSLAELVATARRARGRSVGFDWRFSEGELRGLQRAVFEWGSGSSGRYRAFDARVLASINVALAESPGFYSLGAPTGQMLAGCEVACTRDGDSFRLMGQAPFDIVFGYGAAGLTAGPPAARHLDAATRAMLATSVGALGWDLERLHEERFRGVRNALYGNRLGYGIPDEATTAGPVVDKEIRFHGPFAAAACDDARSLFADPLARESGVYLWTIPVNGAERPWYVGQTRRGFGRRMAEHVACFLSGQYTVLDPDALMRGEHRLAQDAVPAVWPESLPTFLRYADSLVPQILRLLNVMRIHVAPLADEPGLLNRVEGALGRHYQRHEDAHVRQFFFPGIRVPAAMPYDTPLRVLISSDTALAGLPSEMPV